MSYVSCVFCVSCVSFVFSAHLAFAAVTKRYCYLTARATQASKNYERWVVYVYNSFSVTVGLTSVMFGSCFAKSYICTWEEVWFHWSSASMPQCCVCFLSNQLLRYRKFRAKSLFQEEDLQTPLLCRLYVAGGHLQLLTWESTDFMPAYLLLRISYQLQTWIA